MKICEFRKHSAQYGITIIQAHPYRDGKFSPTPDYVDGIEVVNTNPRHENNDSKCFEIARQYALPITAGSDAHRIEDVGLAAMISDEPITSAEQYLSLLKQGKLRIMRCGEIL